MSLARIHPHPDLLATAGVIRGQSQALVPCCANHACYVAMIAAYSFAADVCKDDLVDMILFVDALSVEIAQRIERGIINFQRPNA